MTDIVERAKNTACDTDCLPKYCVCAVVEELCDEIERLRRDNKHLRDRMEKVADVLYDKGELDTWAAIRNALWQDGE